MSSVVPEIGQTWSDFQCILVLLPRLIFADRFSLKRKLSSQPRFPHHLRNPSIHHPCPGWNKNSGLNVPCDSLRLIHGHVINMNSLITYRLALLDALRWSARVLSILAVSVVLVCAFGEGSNLSHFTARELVLFVFFPVGVCLGMALAWRWEGLGGTITVASLVAFYLVDWLMSSSFPRGFALVALAAPGILFLLCWLWTRSTPKQK